MLITFDRGLLELNGIHFWRLCFFVVSYADIRFLDWKFLQKNSLKNRKSQTMGNPFRNIALNFPDWNLKLAHNSWLKVLRSLLRSFFDFKYIECFWSWNHFVLHFFEKKSISFRGVETPFPSRNFWAVFRGGNHS